MIQPTGFFRAKTDALIKLGAALVERFDGEVPRPAGGPGHAARGRPQDRQRGAGQRLRRPRHHRRHPLRPAGAPVRLDRRDRPGQGRARGRRAVPASATGRCFSHVLIFHGRRTCHARKPACGACPVARWCPSYGEGETDPVKAAQAAEVRARAGRLRDRHAGARVPAAPDVDGPAPGTVLERHPARRTSAGSCRRTRAAAARPCSCCSGPVPDGGEDVVLTERRRHLRSHPGQVAFPGGALDPGDAGPVAAALREAQEEVGPRPGRRRGRRRRCRRSTCPRAASSSPRCSAWWARPVAGPGGRPGRGRAGGAGAAVRPDRPRRPVHRTPPERLRRPGVRGRRPARLGLHRRAAGQGARAGRAGPRRGTRPTGGRCPSAGRAGGAATPAPSPREAVQP